MPAVSLPSEPAAPPRCRCGHDRTHARVHAEPRYGFWAWLLLLNGASAVPRRVVYRCGRCGEAVETVTDPRELRRIH